MKTKINMSDAVFPNKNENEFVEMAERLGFRELIFISTNTSYTLPRIETKIVLKKGILIKDFSKLSKSRKSFDYVFCEASRQAFESKIDYIIHSDFSDAKDSVHYRRTALNQVHAQLSKEKGSTIVFSTDSLEYPAGKSSRKTAVALGRMMQNAKVCKKYRNKIAVFTLATSPEDMKPVHVLKAFSKTLGL